MTSLHSFTSLLPHVAGPLTAFLVMGASSAQIYDNGPLHTAMTGGGVGGTWPVSVLQSFTPMSHTTFGYGAQEAATRRVVDDFYVGNSMVITEIELFGYTTGATAPSCTGVYVQIWNADPASGTAIGLITGGLTNMVGVATNTFTNVYRVLNQVPLPPYPSTARNIQSVRIDLTAQGTPQTLTLPTGTYWIEYSFDGITWVPPLTTRNRHSTGNARQNLNGTYTAMLNGSDTVGLPFRFFGPAQAAAPGTIAALLGGCSAATLTVEGAPVAGGYFRAELENVASGWWPFISVDFADPNLQWAGCTCVFHSNAWGLGGSYEFNFPLNSSYLGVSLFIQGAQVDLGNVGPPAACLLGGIPFELTDAYRLTVNAN